MGEKPVVYCEKQHAGIVVPDILAAVEYYTTKLGFSEGFLWEDPPIFAGVNLGEQQVFLKLGTPGPAPCTVYFVVGDVDELYAYHQGNGVAIDWEPGDRAYGLRDYAVRDLNGYQLLFGQYIYNVGPRIEIERVDVPVRLEKRLAAALAELAVHKRMTVGECLEETLLHTFEPLGDGVASPHTKSQLQLIQALKQKHGIDYGTHGSYLFSERADG